MHVHHARRRPKKSSRTLHCGFKAAAHLVPSLLVRGRTSRVSLKAKEADDLERDERDERERHDERKDEAAAAPVARVPQHVAHALGRRAQAHVRGVDVLVQLLQQARVQVDLLVDRHGDVLGVVLLF